MKTSSTFRLTGLTTFKAMNLFMDNFYCNDNQTKKVPIDILNCNDIDILNAFILG